MFGIQSETSLLISCGKFSSLSAEEWGSLWPRSEGTSSVAFAVLTIKSEIDFINLFIFNCLKSNINLFIFNCISQIKIYSTSTVWRQIFIFWRTYFSQAEENGCLWTRVLSFGFSTQLGKWWPVIFETQTDFWGTAHCARTYKNSNSLQKI